MDSLTSYLMSEHKPSVSKEQLLIHAKQAANAYIDCGTPLNDSIKAMSKEAGLNEEQTLRVIQMANTFTSRSLRTRTQGVRGNIDFDLAQPSSVLGKQHVGFMADSAMEKVASSDIVKLESSAPAHIRGLALESVFGYSEGYAPEGFEKSAHDVTVEYIEAVDSARELGSAWDAQVSGFELSAFNCQKEMLQAFEDGEEPGEIAALMKCAGLSAQAMDVLTSDYVGMFKSASAESVADALPATEHPLYQASLGLAEIEANLARIQQEVSALPSDHAEIVRLKTRILA